MIKQLQTGSSNIIGLKLGGQLHDHDYKIIMPPLEAAVAAEGKLCVFVRCKEDFQEWDLNADWEDMKFAACHESDVDRIAFVGNTKWDDWKWMAKICNLFSRATVRHFAASEVEAAWAWLGDRPLDTLY